MKKAFAVLTAMVVLLTISSAQPQATLTVANGQQVVNRSGPNLWLDVYMSNNFLIDTIECHQEITTSFGPVRSELIAATPVDENGINDPTKWTMDSTNIVGSDSISHFLMIASNSSNYWPKSVNERKIMEFYPKFFKPFPPYGIIKIRFFNIVLRGVDSNGAAVKVSLPDIYKEVSLGEPPPPDTTADSVFIKITPIINRINNEAKLLVAYKSTTEVDRLGFVLVIPNDLKDPSITLHMAGTSTITLGDRLSDVDFYYVNISAPSNQPFPAQNNFLDLATIQFNIKPVARGVKEAWLLEAYAQRAGDSLALAAVWPFTIDLGEPPIPLEVDIDAGFSLDRDNLTAWIDFYTAGFGFDTLSVKIKLPDSVKINSIYSNLNDRYELTSLSDGNLLLKLILDRPVEASPHSKKFLRFQLNFAASVTGQQTFLFADWQANKGDYLVAITALDKLTGDFGKPAPPLLTVVYFLQRPWEWLSALHQMRQRGYGILNLQWVMNNTIETTGGINFEMPLPDYMSLTADALDLYGHYDLSKNIAVSGLEESDSSWIYTGVYSAENIEKPLLPNPASNNPAAIIQLNIRFEDLAPETFIFYVNKITASGLDGRIINETKSMNLAIDFLKLIFNQFKKGDVNRQFGDGILNQTDVNVLIKIINKLIKATRYQLWAADLNNDGEINSYDLTILQNLLRPDGVEDENNITYEIKGNVIHFFGDQGAELALYNYLGQLVVKQFGNYFDLNALQTGLYFFNLNNNVGKILIK